MKDRLELWVLRAARDDLDPAPLRGLLHLSQAAEDLGDQAQQMVWLIEQREELHPILRIALGESDEVVVRVPVGGGLGGRRRPPGRPPARRRPGLPRPGHPPRRPLPVPAPGPGRPRARRRADRQRPRRGPPDPGRALRLAAHRGRGHATTLERSRTADAAQSASAWSRSIGRPAGSVPGMSERLCLLSVHAHPDDEASKGAATVHRVPRARASARSWSAAPAARRATSSTRPWTPPRCGPACTRCAWRSSTGRPRSSATTRSIMLGYKDSGMPDTPENEDPACFARADLDEAVGRLVEIIRRERPQVMLTYGDDQKGYPHPDHLRVHDISMLAFDAAADADRYPEAGEPWQRPEDLLLGLVAGPGAGACTRRSSSTASSRPTTSAGSTGPRRTTGSPPTSTSPGCTTCGPARCKAHATQIDPDVAVLVRPARRGRAAACTRRTTSSSPAARCRRPSCPRTISSPGYGSASDLRSPARAVQARIGGARWRST